MVSKWFAPLLITSAACSSPAVPGATVDTSRKPAELAVVAAVDAMFSAMREHDETRLRALVAEGAIIVRLKENEAGVMHHWVIPDSEFIAGTAGQPAVIDERFTAPPMVQIDGDMASLWGVYDVRIDGEFKHCGVDAVQLARLGGQWQVTAITYTVHATGCEPTLGD
jgi:hypothetical protein